MSPNVLRFMTCATVCAVAFLLVGCRPDPEAALREFYNNKTWECALEDPLVRAGRDVVPLVLESIPNREMPRRRYAIAALGDIGDPSAKPALQLILHDPSEENNFRADALEALQKIDPAHASKLAQLYQNEKDLLGKHARFIVAGGLFDRYGYWDTVFAAKCR